jgi:predicted nucleic acid-binding protein
MSGDRFLLDTVFVQALLNGRDQYHPKAVALYPRIERAEKWVTGAILIEIGDGLSSIAREVASRFIKRCYEAPDTRVIGVDQELIRRALDLYEARPDKTWSLTDCISFVVMQDNGLTAALTADKHFVQAGFRALLLEEP